MRRLNKNCCCRSGMHSWKTERTLWRSHLCGVQLPGIKSVLVGSLDLVRIPTLLHGEISFGILMLCLFIYLLLFLLLYNGDHRDDRRITCAQLFDGRWSLSRCNRKYKNLLFCVCVIYLCWLEFVKTKMSEPILHISFIERVCIFWIFFISLIINGVLL